MTARILIIDDSKIVRNSLNEHCTAFGYQTLLAASGEEGLHILTEAKADLIITDLLMPGMSGEEVIRFLKSTPSLAAIPIIVVSGNTDDAVITSCIEMGADDVLPKPFEPALLRARICACLERSKLRRMEIRMREEKATERFGQEFVGAICHNFNQPLTVANGDIHFALSVLRHLAASHDYVQAHLPPACNVAYEDCLRDFGIASGRFITPGEMCRVLLESVESVENALQRISQLVQEVSELIRPSAESYIKTGSITNIEESRKPIVLLAMQNDAIRSACEAGLVSAGMRLLSADQESKTAQQAWFSSPHLIIADLNQPDMEDILGILRLKEMKELDTPMIILTDASAPDGANILQPFAGVIDATIERTAPDLLPKLTATCARLLP